MVAAVGTLRSLLHALILIPTGAANIRPDDTPYVDGEIVREGPVGDQGDGKYSAGRGGTGNISGNAMAEGGHPNDADMVPEVATRIDKQESHHVGRGGAGNEHHVHDKTKPSLFDKAKNMLKGDKK